MSRIAPVDPPYRSETQELFDLVMPVGMEPLALFRVMARSERLLPRFMRSGVLDRGPVPARDRELVIHRTTARCGAEYEWGVHVNAFGRPLALGEDLLRATICGDASDPAFDARQAALVRLCDELHETATLGDEAWEALREHFDELQILELIYTVGLYHTVSFLVNGLGLENEAFGARFDELVPGFDAKESGR
jgi:4-carboxymuconolactone decarboxylase